MTAREEALTILRDVADEQVVTKALQVEDDGAGQWAYDPQVDGVIGLVEPHGNLAWIVVYVKDRDFEIGLDLELY